MPSPKTPLFDPIKATSVRFIKLGGGGEWEQSCIEADQTIRLGYHSPFHRAGISGQWDQVLDYWIDVRKGNRGTAANDLRQIRDFYEQPQSTLWMTFYKRMLWWAFASRTVVELEDRSRIRRVIGKWRNTDRFGVPLAEESLDGRLTKVIGYRGTICGLDDEVFQYLVRRINGELPPDVVRAEGALAELQDAVQDLIRGIYWKDFELLVDVMFSRAGYQRVSALGKTQKSIDIDLESPVTLRRAFVQVKSQATRATLLKSVAQFESMPQYDEFFFVCHSPLGLEDYEPHHPNIHVVTGLSLARLVIDAGLVGFLISKRS